MPRAMPPIARIPLARSLPRLLMLPLLEVAAGLAVAAAGYLGALDHGIVLAAAGAFLALLGLATAIVLLTVRLEVREAALRLSWFGGRRAYPLVRGPVTRIRLRGEGAARLRPRSGIVRWGLGRARLRDEEDVEVVRLAPTPSAILVPTQRGRLAVAARDEGALLKALSAAARARQRVADLAAPPPVEVPATAVEEPEPAPEVAGPAVAGPRLMTGIERAQLERRLAEERIARAAVVEGQHLAAATPAAAEARSPDGIAAPPARRRPRVPLPRPRWVRRPVIPRPRPSALLVVLPLVGAAAAWGVGTVLGTLPEPATDDGRLTALALVLAGPATSVAAIMAMTWWPRVVGVVVTGGLVASVFIGRSLMGV